MKRGKKILSLLLVLLIFAGMAMGSGSSDDEGGASITSTEPKEKEKITIEEQVLLDRDGLKITAKEYVDDSIWGEGIKVLVENSSQKNLGVNCKALIVNNYMITDLFSASVAAGKKSNETIYMTSNQLKAAGIENIGQIELYFHVYDSDNYDTVFDADVVTIKTSAYDMMDVAAEVTGTVLYDANGIKVVGKYVDEDSFWGAAVLLYIENNTEKNIVVSCKDLSVNGFMVTALLYGDVYAGKKTVDDITLLSSDLEENSITKIEEIELSFHIYDSDTYDTIVDSEPIKLTLN